MAQKFFRALVQIVIPKEVKRASKQEWGIDAGSNSSSDLLVALLQLYIVPQDKSNMIMKAGDVLVLLGQPRPLAAAKKHLREG